MAGSAVSVDGCSPGLCRSDGCAHQLKMVPCVAVQVEINSNWTRGSRARANWLRPRDLQKLLCRVVSCLPPTRPCVFHWVSRSIRLSFIAPQHMDTIQYARGAGALALIASECVVHTCMPYKQSRMCARQTFNMWLSILIWFIRNAHLKRARACVFLSISPPESSRRCRPEPAPPRLTYVRRRPQR